MSKSDGWRLGRIALCTVVSVTLAITVPTTLGFVCAGACLLLLGMTIGIVVDFERTRPWCRLVGHRPVWQELPAVKPSLLVPPQPFANDARLRWRVCDRCGDQL